MEPTRLLRAQRVSTAALSKLFSLNQFFYDPANKCNSSYIPARAGWGAQEPDRNLAPRPSASPVHAGAGQSSTNYYEDVEPRFARRPSPQPNTSLPSSLTPGGGHCKSRQQEISSVPSLTYF